MQHVDYEYDPIEIEPGGIRQKIFGKRMSSADGLKEAERMMKRGVREASWINPHKGETSVNRLHAPFRN